MDKYKCAIYELIFSLTGCGTRIGPGELEGVILILILFTPQRAAWPGQITLPVQSLHPCSRYERKGKKSTRM